MASLYQDHSLLTSIVWGEHREIPPRETQSGYAPTVGRFVWMGTNTPKQEIQIADPDREEWDEIDLLAPTDEQLMQYAAEFRPPLDYYDE